MDQWLPRASRVEWRKMGSNCPWILWGGVCSKILIVVIVAQLMNMLKKKPH